MRVPVSLRPSVRPFPSVLRPPRFPVPPSLRPPSVGGLSPLEFPQRVPLRTCFRADPFPIIGPPGNQATGATEQRVQRHNANRGATELRILRHSSAWISPNRPTWMPIHPLRCARYRRDIGPQRVALIAAKRIYRTTAQRGNGETEETGNGKKRLF